MCGVPLGITANVPCVRFISVVPILHAVAGDHVEHLVGVGVGVLGERIADLEQRGRRRAVQPICEAFDGDPREIEFFS